MRGILFIIVLILFICFMPKINSLAIQFKQNPTDIARPLLDMEWEVEKLYKKASEQLTAIQDKLNIRSPNHKKSQIIPLNNFVTVH